MKLIQICKHHSTALLLVTSLLLFTVYELSVVRYNNLINTIFPKEKNLLASLLAKSDANPTEPAPVILFWTEYFSEIHQFQSLSQGAASVGSLSDVRCELTSERNRLNSSAAVLIHIRDLNNEEGGANYEFPSFRSPEQYYVFYLLESPMHTQYDLTVFDDGYFNLTFTYRMDSDIFDPYYFIDYHPVLWRSEEDFLQVWRKKSQDIAYYESYCNAPSGRRSVVNMLARYVRVDIYGECGFLKCPKNEEEKCNAMLSTYKFYLAFENSICKDYVTEKIHRALNHGTIPVVFGGATYSEIFPPNSFINALDFPSIAALADYLHQVATDQKLYASYLQWRYDPQWLRLHDRFYPARSGWCALCRRMQKKHRTRKIMYNLSVWWEKDARCLSVDADYWDGGGPEPLQTDGQLNAPVF
ncbi:alpha-(1,3)-fucosyltransferase C-like [Paramacrobiotus metropolitanus]|uniref:alpha-(1,3)-fucosyltransferase C-like n=1 Tax=Paramacrobiotus metropolitanus TaxID=2943436 RepID=UPI002445B653|nr:alpha-(1,3)-fucosyltransferase C-like [Paramacrobiotus metropolitanus]